MNSEVQMLSTTSKTQITPMTPGEQMIKTRTTTTIVAAMVVLSLYVAIATALSIKLWTAYLLDSADMSFRGAVTVLYRVLMLPVTLVRCIAHLPWSFAQGYRYMQNVLFNWSGSIPRYDNWYYINRLADVVVVTFCAYIAVRMKNVERELPLLLDWDERRTPRYRRVLRVLSREIIEVSIVSALVMAHNAGLHILHYFKLRWQWWWDYKHVKLRQPMSREQLLRSTPEMVNFEGILG